MAFYSAASSVSPASLRRRRSNDAVRLLVSVRNAEEARVAIECGVDVVDVKEPARGALGRADDETLRQVADAVAGRAILSFAGGEAIERESSANIAEDRRPIVSGYALFKYGPAGLGDREDARDVLFGAWNSASHEASPIAVAYVDYDDANAPSPERIVDLAIEFGCAGVLFDTFGKAPRLGLTALPEKRMALCIATARAAGLIVSLAGSLGANDVVDVRRLGADLIAVRGAACASGRQSSIDARRLAEIRESIARDASLCADSDAKRREAQRSDFACSAGRADGIAKALDARCDVPPRRDEFA